MTLLVRVGALVALAVPAVPASVAGSVPSPKCARTYSLHDFAWAARRAYHGTRIPSKADLAGLHTRVVCQRRRADQPRARAFLRREKAGWWERRHPFSAPVIASWYDDSGATGCGFHARYGIATFAVGCGGRVTLRHGSRTVVAVRDDSGPYVAGRMFDLNPTVKAALGCSDLCAVRFRR